MAALIFLPLQPLVDLTTREIVGAEALLRWRHADRGLLPPSEFVPLAEETGLIVPIGVWVLGEACRQLRDWHQRFPAARHLGIAVNVAARHVQTDELIDTVVATLAASGLAAECLTLELTEDAMVADWEAARTRLADLKARGVRIALDDFGTGYSFLSRLQHLPVDNLKIDRAFVSQIVEADFASYGLAETVMALARTLRLGVTAEGIETAAQASALRCLGCRFGQGFHYGRPCPPEEFEVWLTRLAEPTAAGHAAT